VAFFCISLSMRVPSCAWYRPQNSGFLCSRSFGEMESGWVRALYLKALRRGSVFGAALKYEGDSESEAPAPTRRHGNILKQL
jgi:hypothetical protein